MNGLHGKQNLLNEVKSNSQWLNYSSYLLPRHILGQTSHHCILQDTRKFPYNFLFRGLQGQTWQANLHPNYSLSKT